MFEWSTLPEVQGDVIVVSPPVAYPTVMIRNSAHRNARRSLEGYLLDGWRIVGKMSLTADYQGHNEYIVLQRPS